MKTFISSTFSAIRFFVAKGFHASCACRQLFLGQMAALLFMMYASFVSAQTSATRATVAAFLRNNARAWACVFAIGASPIAIAQTEIITNFAGSGGPAFSGDGGQASVATLRLPHAMVFDRVGNSYIADLGNSRIRRVDINGVISTIAGGGASTADGVQATNALIAAPDGLAIDNAGAIYYADRNDHRVRKISTTGVITTVAGISNTAGYSGDGGLATQAQLFAPNAVVVDANGNVFIADTNNNRVRRVDTNGIITTVVGNGIAGFGGNGVPATSVSLSGATDLKLDPQGNLLIAGQRRLHRVNSAGIISLIAGGGIAETVNGVAAIDASFAGLISVAVDLAGNTYVSDDLSKVFKIDTRGVLTRFAGFSTTPSDNIPGPALNSALGAVKKLSTSPRGDLFISQGETVRHRVSKVALSPSLPPQLPLSRRGGIDLDGQGRSAMVVQANQGNQLIAGRLVNNVFQWTNLPGPSADFRIIAPIDFSGNGKSDLPMLRETPLNSSGQGSAQYWPDFSGAAPVLLREVKPAWDVQAVGDLDGDTFGDLVWRFRGQSPNIDDQGVSYIWFSNGAGLSQVRKRGGAPLTWTLLGAADLNGDGAADMVYISPTNTMRVLMATPNRTCANLNGGSIPTGFTALKLARFASSERSGVLIRNAATGEVRLIFLEATGLTLPPYAGTPDDPNASCTSSTLIVTQTNFNLGTTDPTWTLYATGDFDGNGSYDIVWRRPDNTLTLWLTVEVSSGNLVTIVNNAGTAPANAIALPLQ